MRAEFFAGEVVAPIAESAFRKFLNVAFVDEGDAGFVVIEGELDGAADQAFCAGGRNGLDADAGIPANLFFAALEHVVVEEFEEFFYFGGAAFPFDADVNVFSVLAEDDHVHFFRLADRGGNPGEITDGADAGIEVENLAEGDVERADAAPDGSRERAFDGNAKIAGGVDGVIGEPLLEGVESFFAGENFEPGDVALAAIGFFYCGVEHAARGFPDVAASAVAFDEGDDGIVGHLQRVVRVANGLAIGGHWHTVVRGLHSLVPLGATLRECLVRGAMANQKLYHRGVRG